MSCNLMVTDYNSQPDRQDLSLEFYVAASLCYDPYEPSLTPEQDQERHKLQRDSDRNSRGQTVGA